MKLFPHIARAARRDASRESSQIDANRFAILILAARKKKRKEEPEEGRKEMRGHLGDEEGSAAIIRRYFGNIFFSYANVPYRRDLDRANIIFRALDR